MVGARQKFGGALLRLAVLARVLLLLLHQVFMLHFRRAHGGFRLFEHGFGGGEFGGEVFQFGRDTVEARFLGNQAFLRGFGIEQDADFVDLMAFRREPDLVCAQIALMREGVAQIGRAQYAVEPVVQRRLKRRLRLDLVQQCLYGQGFFDAAGEVVWKPCRLPLWQWRGRNEAVRHATGVQTFSKDDGQGVLPLGGGGDVLP